MKLLLNSCIACILAISSFHAAALPSESGAERTQRTVNISGKYKGISVSNAITVNYQAKSGATTTTCVVEGIRDAVELVRIEVDGDELEIYMSDRKFNSSHGPAPVVTVTGLPVASFETSSAAIVNVNTAISTKGKFSADASSSGIINLNSGVTASRMEVEGTSGSIINANAVVKVNDEIEIEASSGANLQLKKLDCGKVSVDCSSGAIVTVSGAAESASVDVSSGSITDCAGLKVRGRYEIEASSGAIVNHSSANAVVNKSSGAIINRK